MIEVRNKWVPIGKEFDAMSVWPFIFTKGKLTARQKRHEEIHGEQQKEVTLWCMLMCVIMLLAGGGWWSLAILPGYYYLYVAEWVVRSIKSRSSFQGYRNISFEREAYDNQDDIEYLKTREPFVWADYF